MNGISPRAPATIGMDENLNEATPEIRPFRIAIPDSDLAELKERLAAARWPGLVSDPDWRDGVDAQDLQSLARHWRDGYDWRRHEEALNRLPQFETVIDGATVHFVHQPSPRPDAQPLILFHGWPSSIVEYRHVIASLAERGAVHGA